MFVTVKSYSFSKTLTLNESPILIFNLSAIDFEMQISFRRAKDKK